MTKEKRPEHCKELPDNCGGECQLTRMLNLCEANGAGLLTLIIVVQMENAELKKQIADLKAQRKGV